MRLFRYSANADAKEMKEGKEKINDKDGKEVEPSRSVSVLSSLSYRKRSNLKDSIGGTGDDSSLFNTLKEQPDTLDHASIRKSKSKSGDLQEDWKKSRSQEDLEDKGSVISLAYSEATSRARKGLESRWTSRSSPEFDKESMVSSVGPSRMSTRRAMMDMDDDNKSTISSVSRSSPRSLHRSTSWKDERRNSSRLSVARSCGLSEFGLHVDDDDDGQSVAFSRGGASPYSPRSRSRSLSTSAQTRSSDNNPLDTSDIKLVTHRNYLDPDLEAAINEVLSFKPIKFKRSKLDESSDEDKDEKMKQVSEDSRKKVESEGLGCSTSNPLRSSLGSTLEHSNRPTSTSSSRSCLDKKGKVSSSESSSSSDDHHSRKSSKLKKGKKKSKKSSKKKSESEDSSSSSESSSSNSAISYRSSSSIKKCPKQESDDDEKELPGHGKSSKKETKKKQKKMDSLVMKYLYRHDSDWY